MVGKGFSNGFYIFEIYSYSIYNVNYIADNLISY